MRQDACFIIDSQLTVLTSMSVSVYLWIGVAVVGLGTSSMWSCMFSYIEDYSYFQNSLFSICICSHRRVYLSAHHFIFHLFRPNDLHVGYSSLFFLSRRHLCDVSPRGFTPFR